jgi:hypothetical protein
LSCISLAAVWSAIDSKSFVSEMAFPPFKLAIFEGFGDNLVVVAGFIVATFAIVALVFWFANILESAQSTFDSRSGRWLRARGFEAVDLK